MGCGGARHAPAGDNGAATSGHRAPRLGGVVVHEQPAQSPSLAPAAPVLRLRMATMMKIGGESGATGALTRLRSPAGLLVASMALTAALYVVPFGRTIGYPLVLLSTLVHELGHGITGVLLGGRFELFHMEWDASGVALVSTQGGRMTRALVSAGGLVGPAVAAALGFVLARRPTTARWFLVGLGAALAIACVWVVRGVAGWVVVPFFAAAFIAIGLRAKPWVAQLALAFLSVQLSLSVFSRGDYLFTESAGTGPSDVANMATSLFLPYWFWGLVCGGFSVAVLIVGSWVFLRGARGAIGDAFAVSRAAAAKAKRRG